MVSAHRWDVYLAMKDEGIHWFAIVNSLVIVFFLTGIIALILTRVLRRDFARYSQEDKDEVLKEMREDTGWKLVSADVFRPPPNATLLSVVGLHQRILAPAPCSLRHESPHNRA